MASATVIIESQPPNFGQFLAVKKLVLEYDSVILCIIDKPSLMATSKSLNMWGMALSDYPEVQITSSDLDFLAIATIPKNLNADVYYVSDKNIFAHLSSSGYKMEFLGHVQGYNDLFIRVAYRQGLARDYLARFAQF